MSKLKEYCQSYGFNVTISPSLLQGPVGYKQCKTTPAEYRVLCRAQAIVEYLLTPLHLTNR